MSQQIKSFDFWEKQLKLLGDRDPFSVLESTPGRLEEVASRYSPQELQKRVFEGKWSIHEIMTHLADMEWVFGFRMRSILCDDRPVLQPVDQEQWNTQQDPSRRTVGEVLQAFSSLRRLNQTLWRKLSAEELQRAGVHGENNADVSLALLLKLQAGHDLLHLEQIGMRVSNLASF